MAEKSGYPMGSAPPPPPNQAYPPPPPAYQAAAAPPPAYPVYPGPQQTGVTVYPTKGGQTTVVVQQQAPKTQVKSSPGFFGMLTKELDVAANMITREADYVGRQITGTVDQHAQTDLLRMFQTSNVVQLISVSSGRALQIVMDPTGQLVVDGLGKEGNVREAYNAHWTVINEGKNQIRLHNNMNFLAISKGYTCVINANQFPQVQQGIETRFQLSQVGVTKFVTLESCAERGKHIGIMTNGQLKSAVATSKGQDGRFGVRLIYSPYPK